MIKQADIYGTRQMAVDMENPSEQAADKSLIYLSGIDSRALREANLTSAQLEMMAQRLSDNAYYLNKIWYQHEPSMNCEQLEGTLGHYKDKHNIDTFWLDHRFCLSVPDRYRTENAQATYTTDGLKSIALNLGICLNVLDVLGKDYSRKRRLPNKGDLYFSAKVDYNCQNIILLHTEDYHTRMNSLSEEDSFTYLFLVVAKSKMGGLATLAFGYDREKQRIRPLRPDEEEGAAEIFNKDQKKTHKHMRDSEDKF
jgi:replicative DNA helicase